MKGAKIFTILVLALSFFVYPANVSSAVPMGTAWTYQGRLMDANGPADGVFEFEFKLYDSPTGGNQLESTFSLCGIDVIDGYFTVELDFGSEVFDSNECWLEIGVRPGDSVEPFTTLSPRQRMAPTPYALQTRGIFVDDEPYIVNYPGTWTAKESNRMWRSVAMSADGTKQTAVAAFGQIYISTDSGNTWTAKESNRMWEAVAMSADGTIQTAVVYGGQIYVSTDSGNTWTPKESDRYWRSVAMSADGTKQTAVGQNLQIYVSTDSGNTWIVWDLWRNWQSVAMSADGTIQTAVVYGGQIYVSTNSGKSWTAKESDRQWISVAISADGIKQTAVVYNGQIYVSTDSGNTWSAKESSRGWYSVAMSADGTRQTAVVNNGQVYISPDSGNTWVAKESNREWFSVAMSADWTKHTAVVNNGQIHVCSVDMDYYYNVGIGTTSPLADLHIANKGSTASLKLENLQATSAWDIWSDKNGVFYIGESTEFGGFTRLTISPDGDTELVPLGGNVGIGTTSPGSKLDVQGGSDTAVYAQSSGSNAISATSTAGGGFAAVLANAATPNTYGIWGSSSSYVGGRFESDTGTALEAYTSSGHAATFMGGNVGIGTSGPKQSLHNAGDYYGKGHIWLHAYEGDGSSGTVYIQARDDSGTSTISTQFRTQSSGSLVDVMYLSPMGSVGIGTSIPGDKLDVNGDININSLYKIAGETVLSNKGSYNIFLGVGTGASNTDGENNTFLGYQAGYSNTGDLSTPHLGSFNTFVGSTAGRWNTTGYGNTFVGYSAGGDNETGDSDTFLGHDAGHDNTEGYGNTFVGFAAGRWNTTGNENTCLGDAAGHDNKTGSGNVFIGYEAGYYETGSNKLYIANNKTTPLIYGNFSTGRVGINNTGPQGALDVNGSIYQRGILLHGDYVFEPGYELESIEEHSEFMWQHKHLAAIPKAKVDENGVEIVEVGAHRRGIVEELEKAHIYIEQLNNRIKTLEEKLAKFEAVLNPAQ